MLVEKPFLSLVLCLTAES